MVHVDELGHEHVVAHVDTVRWFLEMCRARHISIAPIEYTLEGPSVVHSRLCGWCLLSGTVYLIYFLIGNLSCTPCSEPSNTVLLLDVMHTTDPHQRSKSNSPPCQLHMVNGEL